nr:DNA polymerase [Kofleriaceae bacterium]
MADRTLVASATNLLARGFLVVPTDRRSRAGEPTNGLFAVARAIRRTIAWRTPARAIAVIESDPAARATWPALLAAQLAPLPELLAALGMHVVHAAGEVHAVASYTRAARERGDDVVIVGVDKRYAQLVTDRVWWYDANKDARYTPDVVFKRFAVPPERVADWLALVGDDDQMPGIAGIGAKGATQLLEAHGSAEAALAAAVAGAVAGTASPANAGHAAAPEAVRSTASPANAGHAAAPKAVRSTIDGRTGKALRAAVDDVPRELARARLDPQRPLPTPLDDCAYVAPRASELNPLLDRLAFAELLVPEGETTAVDVVDSPDALAAALARLGSPVAIHALVEDPAPIRAELAGIALAAADDAHGSAIYIAAGSPAWPPLATWLADPASPKLGHDLAAATVALRRAGIALAGVAGDSMHASHLTQPSNWAPHDLGVVAKPVLGRALPDDDAVRGVGRARKAWSQLPADRAGEVAAQRASTAAALWRALSPGVAAELLDDYLELAELAVRMELAGILVDPAELDSAEQAFAAIEAELDVDIYKLAGHDFNINSSQQLGRVLFEELKLPIVSHTKTGWSTSIEALERIEHAHPIVALVLRWRLLRRLRDSWVNGLRKCIDVDGRVHSRFHVARSFSGHLVNTAPDLSRVPGRTPEMARIRRAFRAAPGRVLMSVDFHQLGLYVLAHLTKDPALVEPLRARADMHRLTAGAVLDKPPADVTLDERQLGKVINFATFAGQGASALAQQLNVPAAEAKEYLARFDRRYARVRAFQDDQLRLASERGYITTIAGRRWPIGGLESLDSHDRSYAERLARRAPHEGSVSDVSRRALRDADRALRAASLDAIAVHSILDEVLFDVRADQLADAARVASHAMRHAFELEVPLVVGVEAGTHWADLEPVTL